MSDNFIQNLLAILGTEKVLFGEELASRYTHLWHMDKSLVAKAVLLPTSTQDVADRLKFCNEHEQSVVVHGGLTNLVGGTNTLQSDVVISLEKMNKIIEIDTESRTVSVEAGAILENLHTAVNEHDLMFPLNFGAKGSAQIGGMISSNAGGLRVLRFGMTRHLVLGLEAVLADGTIMSSMKKIIKDNSAYDLKQLFIGSEGTLGIVTKAVLKLVEAPKSRCSAFVAFNAYDKVVGFLRYIDQGLTGLLSGYELIWKDTYEQMISPKHVTAPLPSTYKLYVLFESLGSNQIEDQMKMERLLETAINENYILDAAPAQDRSQLNSFWNIREDVHVIKSTCTIDQHFDISLPIRDIGAYVDETLLKLRKIDGVQQAYAFGHIADGNIHFIVDKENHDDSLRKEINTAVYTPLQAMHGSVSAEHGIGQDKRDYLKLCRTGEEIQLMRLLKKTLDPKSILNNRLIFKES